MTRIVVSLLLAIGTAAAQTTVAPTNEPVGPRRGDDWKTYNIENSIETGYRLRLASGNIGKFRSDVNYGNGIRLLSSSLAIRSKDGHGQYFDELTLTTLGLGNDPYESAALRVQKNKIYRYDLLWRLNEYSNPALTISAGQHLLNTSRRMQDHDLVLLPDSSFKVFLGYSRNVQTGPALTTVQQFDARGDEFPLFADIRRERNEYRLGNEFQLMGVKVNWMHAWADFKEDTPVALASSASGSNPQAGNNPDDAVTLSSLRRTEPYHGRSPFWRVALFRENGKRFALNGRFTYTAGERAFVLDESVFGTSRFGAPFNRQILTYGNARRPVATGNLGFTFFLGPNVTITNHTAVYNVRTEGDSFYRSVDNSTLATTLLYFQYLGIRTISNQTDVNVWLRPSFGLFAGYTFSDRDTKSTQQTQVEATAEAEISSQSNRLHSGTLGVRWRPIKPVLVMGSAEIGRSDRPIFPTSERNYHALGARVQYQTRTLRFATFTRTNYNTNSVSLSSFSSRSRQYAGEASWVPSARWSLDASYAKLHLDTQGGIAYFADFTLITGERSYYFSNIHHANATVHYAVGPRVDLFVGYSRVQDTGDGRSNPFGRGIGTALPALQAAQTFPLTYQSPLARISVRLRERLRWNAGYQYYGYREDFSAAQNYRANTGYTSLLWSF